VLRPRKRNQNRKLNLIARLRAYFGTDNRINAVFGSDSDAKAEVEIELFFGADSKVLQMPFSDDELTLKSSTGVQRTLCIIHTDNESIRNQVIERIICRGLKIARRNETTLDSDMISQLYPGIRDRPEYELVLDLQTKYFSTHSEKVYWY
jgi:nucleoside diphosphate kinase